MTLACILVQRSRSATAFLFGASALLVVACGDDTTASGGSGEGGSAPEGGGGGGGGEVAPVCTEPTAVPCEDDVILAMNLQDEPAPGLIENEPDGDGFASMIDATAGGAFTTTPDSYTFGKFTDEGLVKVELSDEEALASMDWDISFRRYVVRINSGHSGPSCVGAARVPGEPDYEGLVAVPEEGSLSYRTDEYFTESCELIADGTGLEGSPATALSSYWTYPGCVQMTGNVYVVRLADGRQVKLTVTHFYNEDAQTECQEAETIPMMNNGSANIRVRWAFLP